MAINALFVVEGRRTEREIVNRLILKMLEDNEIKVHPVSVCTNIHILYHMLKDMGGFANIRDVLLMMKNVSEKDKEMLRNLKFAYTYLVFDLEPQHDFHHRGILTDEDVAQNLCEVEEMLLYFNDETDETIGKLYVNYPMVESYRDHGSEFEDYLKREVSVEECSRYKTIVSQRGDNRNLSKYGSDDMELLMNYNLRKMGYLVNGNKNPDYEVYISELTQLAVFQAEKSIISDRNLVSVLNTLMILPVDYRGKDWFKTRNLNEN